MEREDKLYAAFELYVMQQMELYSEDKWDSAEYSLNHKRRVNRLFRNNVGSDVIPYPEVEE